MQSGSGRSAVSLLAAVALGVCCASASATVIASRSAGTLAGAIVADPGTLTGASFVTIPDDGKPTGTVFASGFGSAILPPEGTGMAVLSNGDATAINTDQTQVIDYTNAPSNVDDSTDTKVDGAYDVTILQLDVTAPSYANCLGVNADYLTADVPAAVTGEQVMESFLDGAIIELDPTSQWNLSEFGDGSVLPYSGSADPANFAINAQGDLLDGNLMINDFTDLEANPFYWQWAAHTPYSVGTGWGVYLTPVTPGPHVVDFSIFDRGDRNEDSTLLLNGLSFFRTSPANHSVGLSCDRGWNGGPGSDTTPPAVTLVSPVGGSSTTSVTPNLSGTIGTDYGDLPAVTVKLYAGSSASGTPIQTLTATNSLGSWSATPAPLAVGTYTAQASQQDLSGNVGLSASGTFTVTSPPTATGTSPGTSPNTTATTATAGHASVSGTSAGVPVQCTGASGTTCDVAVSLSDTETLKGGKLTAISAKAKPKTKKRTVSVGTSSVTLAAGQNVTVTVKLNSTGQSLLRRRHLLPVKLIVTDGTTLLSSQAVTFKQPSKMRH
jgi:hypothetical protein